MYDVSGVALIVILVSLEPRLSILDFILQLSPQLRDKFVIESLSLKLHSVDVC